MNSLFNSRSLRLALLAGMIWFAFECGFFHVSCVDVGFHIRTGALVLQQGSIPVRNTFSFTQPEQPWLLHQWAPGVLLCLVERWGGIPGLVLFKALLGTVIFLVVLVSALREAGRTSLWPYWALTFGLMLARVRFYERPFLVSALFLALLVWLHRLRVTHRSWVWIGMPLLMAVWANVHVGVVDGFVYLAAVWVGDLLAAWQRRKLDSESAVPALCRTAAGILAAALLSVVAVWGINPNGAQVLLLPMAYFLDPFWRDLILEFQSPQGTLAWLLGAFVALALALQTFNFRQVRWPLLAPMLVFAVLAFRTQRMILGFAIVAVPHLALVLEQAALRLPVLVRQCHAVLLLPLWGLLAFGVLWPDPMYRHGIGVYPGFHPVRIFDFMREQMPRQNVYNDMKYGAGMLWWLYPDFAPFIDGRCEAYSREFWQDVYVPVTRAQGWKETFRRYDVHAALVPVPFGLGGRGLSQALRQDPDWALVAMDDRTLLFAERTEGNRRLIESSEFKRLWPADVSLDAVTPQTAGAMAEEAGRALARDPEFSYARRVLARACLVQEQFGPACRFYAELVGDRFAGGGPACWRDYGYALYRAGRIEEADAVFQRMIRRGMEPAFSLYMRHFVALQRGDRPAAVKYIRKAEALDPSSEIYRQARQQLEPDGG